MSERSPNLNMPYLQPSQAQKHVTHNEALQQLDALVQISVQGFDATTPPGSPAAGERHALGTGTTGVWAGQDGTLASWDGVAWQFIAPLEGWQAWGVAEAELRVFQSGAWAVLQPSEWGINTTASASNRLAVASDATLLTHDGNGHQVKVNKASGTDTASLLFQSNWTGHAEMGLAGSTDFSVKVSADGAAWTTALAFDPATAAVSGQAVQQDAADVAPGRLMLAQHGITRPGIVGPVSMAGGVPAGAVIERGSGASGEWVKWADGTALVTRQVTIDINTDGAQDFGFPIPLSLTRSGGYVGSNASESSGTGSLSRREAMAMMALWLTATGWRIRLRNPIAADVVTCRLSATGLWI